MMTTERCGDCGVLVTEPMFAYTGCGTDFREAGIVMAEPVDFNVRRACGPQVQACCGHCHMAVTYWYHLQYHDFNRPATPAEIAEYREFLDRLRVINPAAHPRVKELFRESLQDLGTLPEEEGGDDA